MASINTISSPKPLCPVVDGFGVARVCFFSPQNLLLWSKEHGDASSVPVVLSHLTPLLQVVIDPPGNYTLLAQFEDQPITTVTLVVPTNTQVTIKLLGAKVPRWIVGQVVWTVTDLTTHKVSTLQTKLELYILHDPLPYFFDNQGIPLSLLRWIPRALPGWMKADQDWAFYITIALFTIPFFEYETFKGVSKYTSYGQPPYDFSVLHGLVINCWLELFLSDVNGAMERDDKTKYAINCYDMAALAQTFMTLGTDFTAIRAKYMEPVGFMLSTHLIGRKDTTTSAGKNPTNLCNNPFYGCPGYSKLMLCDVHDKNRSPLKNHMFLAQNRSNGPVVFDACCGPETGDRLLSSYATGVVDPNEPAGAEFKPGTLANIYDGPGVSALAVSAFFDPKIRTGFPFVERMMKTLSPFGSLQVPCFGLPCSEGAVTVTFTFIPHPNKNFTDDTWTIIIMRFRDLDDLQANYNDREEMIKERTDLGGNETVNLTCRGGFLMFHNDTHYVMGIIESRLASSPNLTEVCKAIEDLVRSFPPLDDLPGVEALVAPDKPVAEGAIFSLMVKVNLHLVLMGSFADEVRPAKAHTTGGKDTELILHMG
jgi:hypothetical protein